MPVTRTSRPNVANCVGAIILGAVLSWDPVANLRQEAALAAVRLQIKPACLQRGQECEQVGLRLPRLGASAPQACMLPEVFEPSRFISQHAANWWASTTTILEASFVTSGATRR